MPARILVLDDETAIRALVARVLDEEGYEVVTAADGFAGLEAAKSTQFDLVITNNCMPGMSGSEVMDRLHVLFPTLPLLHLDDLSHPSSQDFPEGVRTLYKPFSLTTLRETVRKLLPG
ncbi:MAG TPA: response regulator [Gemmatimonadales bacterium]|jgi:CheY-like chemotaxis protein|nr:response regulator [Gemmatimonadales bacterium]